MKVGRIETLIKNLPKEHTIIGREKYFNAAIMVAIVVLKGEACFLFQKRAAKIRQGGEISFPGGGYEIGDQTFEETAIRETIEELGVEREKITVLGSLGTYLGRQGVIIEPYIGRLHIHHLEELKIDAKEVEDVFTVPVDYFLENAPEVYNIRLEQQPFYTNEKGEYIDLLPAKQLGLPEKYHQPWSGKLIDVYFYKVNNEWIWGITAELIYHVVTKLKAIED